MNAIERILLSLKHDVIKTYYNIEKYVYDILYAIYMLIISFIKLSYQIISFPLYILYDILIVGFDTSLDEYFTKYKNDKKNK